MCRGKEFPILAQSAAVREIIALSKVNS